jgi:hypothetical protein
MNIDIDTVLQSCERARRVAAAARACADDDSPVAPVVREMREFLVWIDAAMEAWQRVAPSRDYEEGLAAMEECKKNTQAMLAYFCPANDN